MSAHPANTETQAPLRHRAESLLQVGVAPKSRSAPGTDALALLHKMASDPARASAALKLLHELQVHQVELDLQQEQLEQGWNELQHELDRYAERYQFAPVAHFSTDRNARIVDSNLAAADLFGATQAELGGRGVDTLVTAASRPALLAMLKRLNTSVARASCTVQVSSTDGQLRPLRVVASVMPTDHSLLLIFVETGETGETEMIATSS